MSFFGFITDLDILQTAGLTVVCWMSTSWFECRFYILLPWFFMFAEKRVGVQVKLWQFIDIARHISAILG